MRIALCYSGGMDSRILYHMARAHHPEAEVSAIYWSHGHKQDDDELHHLPSFVLVRQCDWMNIEGIRGGLHGKADANAPIYIPGRNLAFAVLTACQELPDEVWVGALANEQHALSTDKNALFCYMTSATLSYVLSPFLPGGVRIRCPLAEAGYDKGEAARWAIDHGLTTASLAATWSCRSDHKPGTDTAIPCGNCDQCIRRFAIFTMLGDPEAEEYASPILSEGPGRDWLIRLYDAAASKGWTGPEAADCAPFMNWLAEFILLHHSKDAALVGVARLMRRRSHE